MTPKWRHDGDHIPVRAYIDRTLDDLRHYHDTSVRMIQEEIDRRISEIIRERDARLKEVSTRTDTLAAQAAAKDELLLDRIDRVEAVLERARGRQVVYAGMLGAVVAVLTIATLLANHIKL